MRAVGVIRTAHDPITVLTTVALAVFPGLTESIDAQDYSNGLKWAGIVDRCIDKATKSIK